MIDEAYLFQPVSTRIEVKQVWDLVLRINRDPFLRDDSKAQILASVVWDASGLLEFNQGSKTTEIFVPEQFRRAGSFKEIYVNTISFARAFEQITEVLA